MRILHRSMSALLIALAVSVGAPIVHAQDAEWGVHGDTGAGLPLGFIKGNKSTVRAQLEIGINYAEQALAVLQTARGPEEYQNASDLARQSYRMWRFACEGMMLVRHGPRRSKHYVDPLVDMALETVLAARHINIKARLALDAAVKWGSPDDVARGTSDLESTLPMVRSALSLL